MDKIALVGIADIEKLNASELNNVRAVQVHSLRTHRLKTLSIMTRTTTTPSTKPRNRRSSLKLPLILKPQDPNQFLRILLVWSILRNIKKSHK